jgi:hypothetical protein
VGSRVRFVAFLTAMTREALYTETTAPGLSEESFSECYTHLITEHGQTQVLPVLSRFLWGRRAWGRQPGQSAFPAESSVPEMNFRTCLEQTIFRTKQSIPIFLHGFANTDNNWLGGRPVTSSCAEAKKVGMQVRSPPPHS